MDNIDAIAAIGDLAQGGEDFEYDDLGGKKHTIPNEPFSAAKAMLIMREGVKVADAIGIREYWQQTVGEVDEDATRYNSQLAALGPLPEVDTDEYKRYTSEWVKIRPAKKLWPTLLNKAVPNSLELLGNLDQNLFRALAIATITESELKDQVRKNDWPKKLEARTDWLMYNIPFPSLAVIFGAIFRLVSISDFFRILQTTTRTLQTQEETTETTGATETTEDKAEAA